MHAATPVTEAADRGKNGQNIYRVFKISTEIQLNICVDSFGTISFKVSLLQCNKY